MKVINTKFKDLKIISHKKHVDSRGMLREIFNKKIINWNNLIFDFATTSKKNVLRGFHFQYKHQQCKYVNVIKGKILDVVVDLRKNSKTFGKTFSIILSKTNALGLFIPRGFAHAYYSYEKENIIYYKLDDYYNPKFEDGIIYNDPELKLRLPKSNLKISKKDKNLLTLSQFKKKYKYL